MGAAGRTRGRVWSAEDQREQITSPPYSASQAMGGRDGERQEAMRGDDDNDDDDN